MPSVSDRVKETTSTTGTGAITLAGAVTGFAAFSSAFSSGTEVYYAIVGTTTEWEVGVGTFTTTLSRDRVIKSSNANALVNFAAGVKDVFSTIPGEHIQRNETLNATFVWAAYQGDYRFGAL